MAVENGDLVKLNSDYFLHSNVIAEVQAKLVQSPDAAQGLTMSEIRTLLDTSRKYAVPLCEYLDSIGFTRRDGDVRRLTSSEA